MGAKQPFRCDFTELSHSSSVHVEDHPLAQDAVGADEDVELAPALQRGTYEPFRHVHLGDVADGGDSLAPRRRDLVDDRV